MIFSKELDFILFGSYFCAGTPGPVVTETAGRLFPVESNPTCDMLVREQAVCAEA